MPWEGPRTAGAYLETPLTGLIENPEATTALDGAATIWDNTANNKLVLKSFGFSLPGTATINGIELTHVVSRSTGNPVIADADNWMQFQLTTTGDGLGIGEVKLIEFGSIVNVDFRNNGPLGGPSDVWDEVWTPAAINSADFGVTLWMSNFELDTVEIDYLTMTIYYSDAGGGTIPSSLSADSITYIAGGIRGLGPVVRRG